MSRSRRSLCVWIDWNVHKKPSFSFFCTSSKVLKFALSYAISDVGWWLFSWLRMKFKGQCWHKYRCKLLFSLWKFSVSSWELVIKNNFRYALRLCVFEHATKNRRYDSWLYGLCLVWSEQLLAKWMNIEQMSKERDRKFCYSFFQVISRMWLTN